MEHINLYALFQQFYPEKNCTIRFESEVIGNDDSSIKGFTLRQITLSLKQSLKNEKCSAVINLKHHTMYLMNMKHLPTVQGSTKQPKHLHLRVTFVKCE